MKRNLQDTKEDYFNKDFVPLLDSAYSFAMYLTRHEENANDLVQDSYLKAYKSLDSFATGTNPKAWLFRIIKTTFINDFHKRKRELQTEDIDTVFVYDEDDNDPTPSSAYYDLRREVFDQLMGDEVTIAMSRLSPEYREIIILADVEQFSYIEIGDILGLVDGSVRSRLFKARNKLKELLRDYAEGLGYEDKRGEKQEKRKIGKREDDLD